MPTLEQIQAKLKKLQAQADVLLARKAQVAVDQIRDLMLKHGLTTADIEAKAKARRAARGLNGGGKAKAVSSGKAVAKYRDHKTGATWTGHGRAPGWIAGVKDRTQFLIEGARPPGKDYEDDKRYPRNAPKPYAGRGWVASNKVGAAYANGATRMGGLFQAPFVDAKWMPARRELGDPIDTDGSPKRIFACSGLWGLVESEDGVRGWWRSLCSNQVTNCS